jgi:uncharacterized membrane protein YcfT
MINVIKKELTIYTALLTVLILLMHPDLLSEPTVRLGLMQEMGNYIHPLLYTFFIYLVLYFIRAVLGFIIKLFKKKNEEN